MKRERTVFTPLGGIGLKDEDIKKGRVLTTEWAADAKFAWDRGIAIGRYLQELKKGKIIGVHCSKCDRTVVPPRIFCEVCFKRIDDWVYLKDTGTVNTFSLCYITWDMRRVKEPEIPAVIEIDGTNPRVGIMHLLGEVKPEEVKIGMPVKAVWKPKRERQGSITDIKYFKPL